MRHAVRFVALVTALVGLVGILTACGDDEATPSGSPVTLEVTVKGHEVTPTDKLVEVPKGSEVRVEVTSDDAGELHVHSQPEQEVQFSAGTTRASLGKFDIPGRYAVEIHSLDVTVATLEVK